MSNLEQAKAIVQEVAKDRKVDGSDLNKLQELDAKLQALEELKTSPEYKEYENFKKDLQKITNKMLLAGYTVKNDNDYEALKNILKHSSGINIVLPNKSDIPHDSFAIKLNAKGETIVYSERGIGKRRGYIKDGKFIKKPSQMFDADGKSDNNTFNINATSGGPYNKVSAYQSFKQKKGNTNEPKQASSGQTVTPVENTTEAESNTVLKEIREYSIKDLLTKLNDSKNNTYKNIKNSKKYTALLQKALLELKVSSATSYKGEFIIGIYGPATHKAVTEFQKSVGYKENHPNPRRRPDGKAGIQTMGDMISKLKEI